MQDLPQNLRYLCSFHRSVADLCRQIGINRQQFNKYLSGQARPSPNNLRLIATHFHLQSDDFFLPAGEFRSKVEKTLNAFRKRDRLDMRLAAAFPGDLRKLRPMLGYYHSHYLVDGGRFICRSLMEIFEEDGLVYSKLVERSNPTSGFRRGFLSKYEGLVSYINDRLFVIEFETLTKDVISESILIPSYRKRIDVLTGVVIGLSADTKRQPFTTRIAWKAIPARMETKHALTMCGYFANSDKTIDLAIRSYLTALESDALP